MAQAHMIVIKEDDGTVSTFPLKQWLRDNPEHLPSGIHPDNNTSHQLRGALKRNGWKLQFTPNEVLVIRPDESRDTSYADELIDEKEAEDNYDMEAERDTEITFGLERDLQAALRANIRQLEPDLTIIDGGNERTTQGGRIDITAEDGEGNIVVIELKAGRASSDVIAQVLSSI